MEWVLQDKKLIATRRFENQSNLVVFLSKVAEIADNQNHHPDIVVTECSKLILILSTHSVNAATELDYHLAHLIDEISCF